MILQKEREVHECTSNVNQVCHPNHHNSVTHTMVSGNIELVIKNKMRCADKEMEFSRIYTVLLRVHYWMLCVVNYCPETKVNTNYKSVVSFDRGKSRISLGLL